MPACWHILGAGAIGSLFAAYLQRGGCEVVLIDHHEPAPDRRLFEISGLPPCGNFDFPVSAPGEPTPIARLLVTTKAYQVVPAVAAIAHRLNRDSTVVLMVNGRGFIEELQAQHPWLAPCCATTTEGAFRRAAKVIEHAGRGTTRVGRLGEQHAPAWFEDWQSQVPDCHWEPDIEHALWRKLAINAAINPLTAVHRVRNGDLASNPELAVQVRALCAEIAQLGRACGQQLAVSQLETAVFDVIDATADNRSSMLQDVLAGRPTEIDYITGWLVRLAHGIGMELPMNEALLQQVREHVC